MLPSKMAFYSTQGGSASGITYVGGLTDVFGDGGDSVSLTSLGLMQNDVVIAAVCCDGNIEAPDGFTSAGWSTLFGLDSSSSPGAHVIWKRMGATPDTSLAATISDPGGVCIKAFRGVHTTTAIDVTSTTASSGSGMPNPPTIYPVTDDCAIVIVGLLDDDNITATGPTNYTTDFLSANGSSLAGAATTMMGHRILSGSAAEDPGVFGGGGTDAWRAVTIALRPA